MPNSANRVRVQTIDWAQVVPVVRLAGAFRLAIQPGKLLVALAAVLVLHFVGIGLDAVWPNQTVQVSRYNVTINNETGVYASWIAGEARAFQSMVAAAGAMEFGLYSGQTAHGVGVLGALLDLTIHQPLAVIVEHPGFAAVYGLIALVTLVLSGGMICRMAATQACVDEATSVTTAARYVAGRAVWFVLTPLMPLTLIVLLGLILVVAGLVFFNAPGPDVLGAALYGPLLGVGLLVAGVAFVAFFAVHLMVASLAVEGTDGFDAVSRSMNYVMFKPWQLGGYLVTAAVYAAVVYLVIGGVAQLTIGTTATFVEAGVFAEANETAKVSRFEAMHREAQQVAAGRAEGRDDLASWLMGAWLSGVWAVVAAFMLSLYFCLQTLVYLLIRRSADGTPLEECDAGHEDDRWSTPADVHIEPTDSNSDASDAE